MRPTRRHILRAIAFSFLSVALCGDCSGRSINVTDIEPCEIEDKAAAALEAAWIDVNSGTLQAANDVSEQSMIDTELQSALTQTLHDAMTLDVTAGAFPASFHVEDAVASNYSMSPSDTSGIANKQVTRVTSWGIILLVTMSFGSMLAFRTMMDFA